MNQALPLATLPSPGGGAIASPVARGPLSRRAKAAIVVRYLLNEGADIPLEKLPEDLQAGLIHQMGAMRLVDKATVDTVIEEFMAELEAVGLSFPGNIAGALEALDGKVSPHTADRLRKEAGVRHFGNPWARICDQPPEKLKPIFEQESVEVCAVILSKLDVAPAAKLLGMLPGPQARQITYAVNQTNVVTPEAVDRIGLAIATRLAAEPVTAFADGPVQRVGAILNNSTSITREDVLEGLDETDSAFANEVRKAIFTFANIPVRIAPRDVPTIMRELDQGALVTALAGAEKAGMGKTVEFIFENMSARMGDQLRDEMEELGDVKPSEAEEAMSAIVARIREMETAGQILLLTEEEEDDEEAADAAA